jgi:hypothetical protein
MGARNIGWIIFGGMVGLPLLIAVSAVMLPMSNVTYCTAGFETCITNSRIQAWHVVEAPCPRGQAPQFVQPVLFVGISRCHSITMSGFAAPLNVCPTACAKAGA